MSRSGNQNISGKDTRKSEHQEEPIAGFERLWVKTKGFSTARKEAGETQNHIRSMEGKNYILKEVANDLISRYEEVIRGINGYINWVRKKQGAKK